MAAAAALRLLLLLLLILFQGGAAASLSSDAAVLLKFKDQDLLPESVSVLSSGWQPDSDPSTVCSWTGVICSPDSSSVTGLNFTNLFLNGTLSPLLCNLPNLTHLLLRFNNFTQSFPLFLLHLCPNLSYLDLSQNWFFGSLPSNISLLPKLQFLSLESNSFVGPIPPDFGNLPDLRLLRLRGNPLTGPIPPELSNLTELQTLDLAWGISSDPGYLPWELSRLLNLRELSLAGCGFVGTIPEEFGRLQKLTMFDLSTNELTGTVPDSLSTNLTSIVRFYLYDNRLSGSLPPLSGSYTNLSDIQLNQNFFSGAIPETYASFPSLVYLQIYTNNLTGGIPAALASHASLKTFVAYGNLLNGTISSEWGLHSPNILQFDVSDNAFSGDLPPNLCHSGTILYISFKNNAMSGSIPANYATDCTSATRIRFDGNRLSGSVPPGLWLLPNLDFLALSGNMLSGTIDLSSSAAASKLTVLFIDSNQFEGEIPREISKFRNLTKFTASRNKLSGAIPTEITSLQGLEILNLSSNALSGDIPASFNSCDALVSLDLSHNHLTGSIPEEIALLDNLIYLDLSDNSLDGAIPTSFADDNRYVSFNVSHNDLSGMAPRNLVVMFGPDSFVGNPSLCYEDACYEKAESEAERDSRNRSRFIGIMAGVLISFCVLVLCGGVSMTMYAKKRMKAKMETIEWKVIPFQKLGFDEEKIFERLEEKNVIGSGGTGKVYKVSFPSTETTVAVKKIVCAAPPAPAARGSILSSSASTRNLLAFTSEMEILGNIKHKNIIRLLSCAVSDDTRLLVYEYMAMGSLGDVLHEDYRTELSEWAARHRIAAGVAEGLCYLHNDCVPYILHRDIKSNNILIDSGFEPKLGDFGVAKAMDRRNAGRMTAVVGSVGYIAPEYAYTLKVDEKSDVYSYGVVLLELATGRRPTGGGGEEIVKWATKMKDEGDVWGAFDERIEVREGDKESMVALLKIALLCTSAMPNWRPSMREVLHMLRRSAPTTTAIDAAAKHAAASPKRL